MTPEERLRLEKEKLEIELSMDSTKYTYDEASKGDVAAEVGRSFGRGGKDAVEFFADIADVGVAAVDQWIPGMEDQKMLDALNPFAPPDRGDITRQKHLWDTDAAQALTAEKIQRGDSGMLDFTKTAAEYVLPTLTGGPGGFGRQGLKKTLKEIAATSGGAATGELVGGQLGETGGEVGEVIGAVSGGFLSRAAFNKGKQYLSKFFKQDTTDKQLEAAIVAVMEQADNPAKARESFLKAIKDGDEGTLADLMGDAGIYNVEALAEKGTKGARAAHTVAEARDRQMIERVTDVFDKGAPEQASVLAQARQNADRARIAQTQQRRVTDAETKAAKIQEAQAATEEAGRAKYLADRARINAAQQRRSTQAAATQTQEAAESAARTVTAEQSASAAEASADAVEAVVSKVEDAALIRKPVSEQSEKLAANYDRLSNAVRKRKVQPLWDKFDEHPNITTQGVANRVDKQVQAIPEQYRKGVESVFGKELATIKGWGNSTDPKDIHSVISTIKEKMRHVDTPKSLHKFAVDINRRLESFLENSMAGTDYKAARSAEAALQQRVSPGGLGKARAKAEDGKILASKLAKNLEAGAVTADQILQSGSPAVIETFTDTMRALANRANDSGTLNTFLRNNDELLSRFPELRVSLNNLKSAKDTLKGEQAAATVARKTSDQVAKQEERVVSASETALTQARNRADKLAAEGTRAIKSQLKESKLPQATTEAADIQAAKAIAKKGRTHLKARLLGDFANKPQETINKVLRSENAPAEIRTLVKGMGKSGKEHLTSLIGQEFMNAAAKSADGIIHPKIKQQFADIKPALEELMTADEIAVIDDVLDMTKASDMRGTAAVARRTDLNRVQRMYASGVAALAMKFLPGNSLIMAGAARQYVKDTMLRNPDPAILATLEDMISNPRKFEAAIRAYNPKTPKGVKDMFKDLFKRASSSVTGTLTPPAMVNLADEETVYRE